MIDFSSFPALVTMDVGPLEAKPTSFEGHQREAAVSLYSSPDGRVDMGVWECTPGRFRADRSKSSEFCHILTGLVALSHGDGRIEHFGPGDAFNLPLGWKGEWQVIEHVRKVYVAVEG